MSFEGTEARQRGAAQPELVIAGNLLVDDLVFEDGETLDAEPGGAVLYASLAAALWGVRVGVVSLCGDDYPEAALATLAERGVNLSGVHRLDGPGLRAWLHYEPTGRRVVHRALAATHLEASPSFEHFPDAFLAARCIHVAPMPFVAQRAIVRQLAQRSVPAMRSLDPHEPLTPASLNEWSELAGLLDVLSLGLDEVRLPGATERAEVLVEHLPELRGAEILFRRGETGGELLAPNEACAAWKPWAPRVVDSTGAGDAFTAGYLAGRVQSRSRAESIARGLVSASFALEDFGARGLLRATHEEAEQRLAQIAEPVLEPHASRGRSESDAPL